MKAETAMHKELETWQIAKFLVEQHGMNAMHNAREATEILQHADGVSERPDVSNVVRAMDFLLSDEGHGTIH